MTRAEREARTVATIGVVAAFVLVLLILGAAGGSDLQAERAHEHDVAARASTR